MTTGSPDPSPPLPPSAYESVVAALRDPSQVMVCLAKCEPCQFGQCPGGDHRWAGQEDIDHAINIGDPASANGRCGCPCARGPVLDAGPEPPDDVELVSIDGPPCHLCGAAGACGYDPEGRPYIHASWDEDETEEIR